MKKLILLLLTAFALSSFLPVNASSVNSPYIQIKHGKHHKKHHGKGKHGKGKHGKHHGKKGKHGKNRKAINNQLNDSESLSV